MELFIKKKKTNSGSHFSFFLSFYVGVGGIISINLGCKGGLPPQKFLMKREGVIIYYHWLPVKSHHPPYPPPLKMNGPIAEEISISNSIVIFGINTTSDIQGQ